MKDSQKLGEKKISKLLTELSVPTTIGMLVLSIHMLADTVFIGHSVGVLGIAGITVVFPIMLLTSSLGTAIGIGGSTLISRTLGAGDLGKANLVFGNMVLLTLLVSIFIIYLGVFHEEALLTLFGAKGEIIGPAKAYFGVVFIGIPFLAFNIMLATVLNAEGKPKATMLIMVIPAIVNILLDAIFVLGLDMGMKGAALATVIGNMISSAYAVWFFLFTESEIKMTGAIFRFKWSIVKEIAPISLVTLVEKGANAVLIIVFNHTIFLYGGEIAVAVYGILNRLQILLLAPIYGISQGFVSIAGFNYGARKWERVKSSIYTAFHYSTATTLCLITVVLFFPRFFAQIFTTDPELLAGIPSAIRLYLPLLPFTAIGLMGMTYFQAIGKALNALYLNFINTGLLMVMVPLIPMFTGDINGVWIAFPLAGLLNAGFIWQIIRGEIKKISEQKTSPFLEKKPGFLTIGSK